MKKVWLTSITKHSEDILKTCFPTQIQELCSDTDDKLKHPYVSIKYCANLAMKQLAVASEWHL